MESTPMPNVKHVSRSLERHVTASRDHTWAVLLAEIERGVGPYIVEGSPPPHGSGAVLHLAIGDGEPLVETVLSFEPPWRRCYKVEGTGTGLDLYEGTFVIRDDGPECHISWGVVVDPEPSVAGWEFLEFAIGMISGFLDRVVVAAESG
jgi:polyketide cyclase/dehydrase/lipid transport protein